MSALLRFRLVSQIHSYMSDWKIEKKKTVRFTLLTAKQVNTG